MDAFYIAEGDHFISTVNTTGPWHPKLQHAGPPSALMGRALELEAGDLQLVRFSNDLLKPVPVAPLKIELDVVTPGKRRQVIEARLLTVEGEQLVARAQGLFLRQQDIPIEGVRVHDGEPPISPQHADAFDFSFFKTEVGYHTAMELRMASGGPGTGKTQMWMRQRVALVAGEQPSPLQRLLTVADSGNGVSMAVDKNRYSFANPDLTVNMRRAPQGEWICLDAHTHFQNNGLGMAESRLWDERGVVANGTQNLLLELAP
ncbi:MAG: thioesterase family protein [Gammaproteobacteria bacterium]|nr:thioesterase family protein [Gammaproteobacteria bacterium]